MKANSDTSIRPEPVLPDPAAERERRLSDLATAYRLFAAMHWGGLGDGHITCRDTEQPDHLWLLRYGVPFRRAEPGDMVLVAPDGTAADRRGRRAPINDTAHYIHHPIHETRPDVTAIAHVHTHWGTPFAAERRMIEPISQESTLFFENHGLFNDEEVQILSVDGGKRIAVALAGHRAVILTNHGLLTVGTSPGDALGWFLLMERAAEVHMKARHALPISAEAARVAQADLDDGGDYGWITFCWAVRCFLNTS